MAQEPSNQDDFEESLVHEVIEENPPEEPGVRSEWGDHAGWHRKEYVHLRRAGDRRRNDVNDAKPYVINLVEKSIASEIIPQHNLTAWLLSGSIFVMFLLVRIRSILRRKTRKH